ncbi:uncharacterized protein LOC129919092 [Episyrphus balteatus]|uniref:uncharacterized protein LOC129919092 n=1 Tax=Episyrphus balteatus TaxID=286459 RepID=UPI002485BEF5|nr:uncharacterized protein LOC129919092 [Episyrphus balteatus]
MPANNGHCGVPQCNSYRKDGISMFHLPKDVRESPILLKKWSGTLRMGKQFPKQFFICELHFHKHQVLRRNKGNAKSRPVLVKGAFPSQNLPKSVVKTNQIRSRRILSRALSIARSRKCEEHDHGEGNVGEEMNRIDNEDEDAENIGGTDDICSRFCNKGIQVNLNPTIVSSLCDTDKKLKTFTGLDGLSTLDALVNASFKLRKEETPYMSMRDRIILTMSKLKNNSTFAYLAVLFQISEKTAKLYFVDTIKHLAKIVGPLIYWPTREQNAKRMPKCFEYFQNVRTILDCTEMKTVTFRCLKCRTGVYSQYKGAATLKVLIGISPSGAINFLSKVASGRSSDKAIFNRSDLLSKLEPGDAVMVDKGFMIGDELNKAGIEMIRPKFHFEPFSGEDVRRNTRIAAARVHVERRFARLKMFKILSDKIHSSVIPYIDDIMIVLCGLSNYGTPILDDSKF